MKRWAFLTILLYAVCVAVLGIPIYLLLGDSAKDVTQFFYIYLAPVLILIQLILLLVPVAVAQKRPIGRRSIVTSSIIGAIPMAFLVMMFVISVVLMVWSEKQADVYVYNWPILIVPAVFWIIWGFIFYRNYSADNPGIEKNAVLPRLPSWES